VIPLETVNAIPADSTDNKFLEAAIAGKVDFVVSGDKHLLDLKSFKNIPIITAKDFVKGMEAQ
jgi:predicted nucleic acid-binding protein